jgi:hypothetical protein
MESLKYVFTKVFFNVNIGPFSDDIFNKVQYLMFSKSTWMAWPKPPVIGIFNLLPVLMFVKPLSLVQELPSCQNVCMSYVVLSM